MDNLQIKNSFCPVTREKIIKGAFIALSGGVAVGVLAVAWHLGIERASIISLLAFMVPVICNAVREFFSGSTPPT